MPEKISTVTVEARWLLAGVGLPPIRRTHDHRGWQAGWHEPDTTLAPEFRGDFVDLSDPQTAFGVALKLDEWEEASGPWHWAVNVAHLPKQPEYSADLLRTLAARVTHIGQDHHIRRAQKYWDDPQLGTLATLEPWPKGGWVFSGERFSAWFTSEEGADICADTVVVPALAGVTDPTEALRVIAESMERT